MLEIAVPPAWGEITSVRKRPRSARFSVEAASAGDLGHIHLAIMRGRAGRRLSCSLPRRKAFILVMPLLGQPIEPVAGGRGSSLGGVLSPLSERKRRPHLSRRDPSLPEPGETLEWQLTEDCRQCESSRAEPEVSYGPEGTNNFPVERAGGLTHGWMHG